MGAYANDYESLDGSASMVSHRRYMKRFNDVDNSIANCLK